MAMIGVIVPVYKVEPFIHRCVDSILAQTFSDFTLVLVDDGSPDNCGRICDEYARQDPRIRVIHQKNAGLSAARNAAMDYLQREEPVSWLTFVDSDDWVHPRMLECLLAAALEQGTKISSCAYEETDGADPRVTEGEISSSCWGAKEFYLQHFTNATIACAKLYHASCFETMRYPLGRLHEDEFVTYRLLFEEGKLAVIFEPLYAYYINFQGITKKPWVSKRLDAWEAYEQQLAYFKQLQDPELISFRTREYLENALKHYEAARQVAVTAQQKQELKWMRKRIRRLIRECWPIGRIAFWSDLDFLLRFYPLLTRVYRLLLELKK